MNNKLKQISLLDLLRIAHQAGKEILEVYESAFEVERKEDKSPLTEADKKSHAVISKSLEKLYPGTPVLSEEGKNIPYSQRSQWEYFWLVDPLDGTKEFIKRNGQFTVNIALVHNTKSVLGVIYVPVKDTFYLAKEGFGAYKLTGNTALKEIKDDEALISASERLPMIKGRRPYTVIASRSHLSKETEQYIASLRGEYGEIEMISAGSSQKFCLVAERLADCYPRFGPTMEWDTAAGQIIAEEAGATVCITDREQSLRYNKESLLNPWFIVQYERERKDQVFTTNESAQSLFNHCNRVRDLKEQK